MKKTHTAAVAANTPLAGSGVGRITYGCTLKNVVCVLGTKPAPE
ncbi:MAG TPA: hypothetical protein VHD36_21970 [Pirellulales bacterium]|nr:hypothetical protein [Pirellulales bacterium]